ncbi:hypothetical protein [Streptomyces sp. GBA 94-10 4N24]|uniref:hypothetical protein n=1 Tax=Streptomyces sp. GBA 94-10 4N24 TaxID=1218177 RepID=UPI0031F7F7F8
MRLTFDHGRRANCSRSPATCRWTSPSRRRFPTSASGSRPRATARPPTFALPYAAGPVEGAPRSENGKEFSDYFLPERAQKDVEATDANAVAQSRLLKDVEIFTPDWAAVGRKLDRHVGARKSATGS